MSQIDQSTIGSVAVGTILSAGGIVEGLATTTVRSLEGFSGRKGLEGLMKSTMKGGGFKRTAGTNSEITAQPYTMENIPELPYLETQIEKVAETNRRAAMNPRQQQRYTNSLRNKRDKLTIRQGEIEELRFKRESSIAQEENRLKAISDEEERLRFEVATKKAESEAKKQAEAEANKQAEKEAAAVKAKAEVQAKKRAEEEARAASKYEEERLRLEQVTQKEKERLAELRAAIPKQQQRYATVTGGGESLPIFDIEKLRTLLQQLNISPGVVGGLAAATLIVGGSVTAVKRSLNDAKEREDNIQEENAQKDKDDFNNNNNKEPSSSQSTTSTELWSQPKVTALIGRKSADSISQESVKIDETTNKPKQSFSPFGRTENSGNPTSPLSQSKQSFSPFERDPSSSLSTKTESSIKPKQSFSPFQSSIKPPSTMRSSTSYDAPPETSNEQEGKVATTDSKQAASPVGAGFGAPPKVGASRVASPFGAGAAPKQGAEFPKFTAPLKQANSPFGDGFGGSVKTDATPKQSFSPFGVIPKTSSQTSPSGSLGTNNPTSPSSQTASNSSFGTPTSPLSTKDESSIKPKQSFSPFERVAKPSSLTNVGSFPPSVRAPLSTSDALSKKEQEQQERRTENSRLAEVNRRVSAQVLNRDEEEFAQKERLRFKKLEDLRKRAMNAASGIVDEGKEIFENIKDSPSQEPTRAKNNAPADNPSSISSVKNMQKSQFPFSSTGPVYMAPTSKANNYSSLDDVYSSLGGRQNKNGGGGQEKNKGYVNDENAVPASTTSGRPKTSFSPFGRKPVSRSMFNSPSTTVKLSTDQSTSTVARFGVPSPSFGVPMTPQPSTTADTITSSSTSSYDSTSPSIPYPATLSTQEDKKGDPMSRSSNNNSDSGNFVRPLQGQESKKSFSPYGMKTKPKAPSSSFSVYSTPSQNTISSNDSPSQDQASSKSYGSFGTNAPPRAAPSSFSFGAPPASSLGNPSSVSTNLPQSTINQPVPPKIADNPPVAPSNQSYGTTSAPKPFAASAYSQNGGKDGRDERENVIMERDRLKDLEKARKRAMDVIRDEEE